MASASSTGEEIAVGGASCVAKLPWRVYRNHISVNQQNKLTTHEQNRAQNTHLHSLLQERFVQDGYSRGSLVRVLVQHPTLYVYNMCIHTVCVYIQTTV